LVPTPLFPHSLRLHPPPPYLLGVSVFPISIWPIHRHRRSSPTRAFCQWAEQLDTALCHVSRVTPYIFGFKTTVDLTPSKPVMGCLFPRLPLRVLLFFHSCNGFTSQVVMNRHSRSSSLFLSVSSPPPPSMDVCFLRIDFYVFSFPCGASRSPCVDVPVHFVSIFPVANPLLLNP